MLKEHYNSKELAASLIDGGSMSCCWTKSRWTYEGNRIEVEEYGPQYHIRQIDGECPPRLDANLTEYLCNGEEYAYLYRRGEWVCYDLHGQFPETVEIPSGALTV